MKTPILPSIASITLEEIATGLDNNVFTSVHLVKAYIARIQEVNGVFNAVVEVSKDAERVAAELDRERKHCGRRGPLHGVPILLKDNIYTADDMMTCGGSLALMGARAPREASTVMKLRNAGAIILGKTNLCEWATWRSTNSCFGWSARGGQTFGVYFSGMDPAGSSSGSGVASALGLAFACIGTETDGSIVGPCEASGIVGIKPTVGLVSRDSVIPLSERQDTVGPMARTVRDAAEILTAIAGRSRFDKRTWEMPFVKPPNYADQCCQTTDLTGIRIGIPRNSFDNLHNAPASALNKAIQLLLSVGASVVDNVNIQSLNEWDAWSLYDRTRVITSDFKPSIEAYCQSLTENPHNIRTLQDIIDFTVNASGEDYPSRNVELMERSERGPALDSPETQYALQKLLRLCGDEGILGALKQSQTDLLVVPARNGVVQTFAANLGLPIVCVPLGHYPSDSPITRNVRGNLIQRGPNSPFTLSFIGPKYSEQTLLRVAYAFEQLTQVRNIIQPYLMPQTELADVLWPITKIQPYLMPPIAIQPYLMPQTVLQGVLSPITRKIQPYLLPQTELEDVLSPMAKRIELQEVLSPITTKIQPYLMPQTELQDVLSPIMKC